MLSGTRHRILIIDDEPVVRQTLERALSPDYDVMTLSSTHDLDETVRQFPPDLIILDVRMPDENGIEVCDRIRRDRRFDVVPIIFLSGLADEATVRNGFASGGDYYLTKPFDLKELDQVVEAFIGRKHRHPDDPLER